MTCAVEIKVNPCRLLKITYLSTIGMVDERTVASSRSRCGRLPVFSSCSITATTMVSSMPSVSTLVSANIPPGDGGGVCAATRPVLLDPFSMRSGSERGGEVASLSDEDEVETECVRLTFFEGGESAADGGERADRGAPGSAMPSEGSDSDLRRVL